MTQKSHTKLKLRYLVVALIVIGGITWPGWLAPAQAESCPDVKIIFARGSGGERWATEDYLTFKSAIEEKLATTGISYEFEDLDYPAVGVGIDNLSVAIGAYVGAGETYEFGDSVNTGMHNLMEIINGASCPGTKYVLGGYSQGAMVVSKALGSLKSERVIYAATFGDPKLYLPEGEGLIPAACRGENLSDYRMYVPDCQAYKGLLGAYIPYEPAAWVGKVGTWCNKRDIMCSSHLGVSDHVGYVADNLYEDAARVIYDKVAEEFGIEERLTSPHDTAILIDSTGSMAGMIDKYKAEALRLAKETIESGGRVALYDYRDLQDPYSPVERCGFETCTVEIFEDKLNEIVAENGGDIQESLLSAAYRLMQEQNWKLGSTKSLVVLTDAGYLMPDRDGVTLDDVVALSKSIDPVNFYVITTSESGDYYSELAGRTDGLVVTNLDELHLMTDYIIKRYDSLPRVEETVASERPALTVTRTLRSGDEIEVWYETDGDEVIVVVNEMIMGKTREEKLTIRNADKAEILLIPVAGDTRGEVVRVEIEDGHGGMTMPVLVVPKTPNTGQA